MYKIKVNQSTDHLYKNQTTIVIKQSIQFIFDGLKLYAPIFVQKNNDLIIVSTLIE